MDLDLGETQGCCEKIEKKIYVYFLIVLCHLLYLVISRINQLKKYYDVFFYCGKRHTKKLT